MRVCWGIDAGAQKRNQTVPVVWEPSRVINAHLLICGSSGTGKTFSLRKLVREAIATSDEPPRFHIFDVHGDIAIPGESEVLFSEQTTYGMNPLVVGSDPHFGGVRKRVQGFVNTLNRVMRQLGPKQEACLRNILLDLYTSHGFVQDDPSTWHVNPRDAQLVLDGNDGRLAIDVPIGEKDDAKALGARWDQALKTWWVRSDEYEGAITRWPPKTLGRSHPSITDALRRARHVLQASFLGTGQAAVTALEIANKAAAAYQRKRIDALKRGQAGFVDDKLQSELDKAKSKAIETFTAYADAIATGSELDSLIKYDSVEVLKSVVDRLENLNAIGIFKSTPPPFDPAKPVWRYNLRPLSLEERKLFVLFRLEQLFAAAVERGEQSTVRDVIVLDEAHIYQSEDDDNPLNTIAKEARKFGVSLVCASQAPHHFATDFLGNIGATLLLGLSEMHWTASVRAMRCPIEGLEWIKPQRSMLVQIKSRGETRSDWKWTLIQPTTTSTTTREFA